MMNYCLHDTRRRLFHGAALNSVSLVLQGFSEKYYPKRSEGVEIFAKTRRA